MVGIPPPPWNHKGLLAACALGLIALAVVAVVGDHGFLHLRRLQTDQHALDHTVVQLQQRNEVLRRRIQRLQSDDRYIERLARERLGLVKKGEIIYRVGAAAAAPAD
jgi:cell division protein FtsB